MKSSGIKLLNWMKFMNRTMIKPSNKIKKRKEKNPPNDDKIYQHPNLSIFIRNSFHGLRYTSKYLICKWGWCFFHMIWDIIFKHESAEKSQCHLVQGITVMNQDTIYIDCWLYFFVSVFRDLSMFGSYNNTICWLMVQIWCSICISDTGQCYRVWYT